MTEGNKVNKSTTEQRLLSIKPNESIVFYRGNLDDDIKRSKGSYKQILDNLKNFVEYLDDNGIIKIRKSFKTGEISVMEEKRRYSYYEYYAVGLKK